MDQELHLTEFGAGTVLYDAAGRRFEIVRPLGRGAFGAVYETRILSSGGLEQVVALKLLHPGLDPRSQPVARLRDEAQVLSRLRHPVIVAAHDLVELDGRLALLTELVDGDDLGALIRDDLDPLPLGPLLDAVAQVAGALDGAWTTCGVVHRDVTPANVRISRHGGVKLVDFGLARSDLLPREAHTEAHAVVGSLWYLAPERFDPEQPDTAAADVWALGCLLFEGSTGRALLQGVDLPTVVGLARSASELEDFLVERLLLVPHPEVRALVAETLRYDPANRPTAREVEARCDVILPTLPEPLALRPWCRRHPWPDRDPTEPPASQLFAIPARPGLEASLPETVIRPRPKAPPAEPTIPPASPTLLPSPGPAPRTVFANPLVAPAVTAAPVPPAAVGGAATPANGAKPAKPAGPTSADRGGAGPRPGAGGSGRETPSGAGSVDRWRVGLAAAATTTTAATVVAIGAALGLGLLGLGLVVREWRAVEPQVEKPALPPTFTEPLEPPEVLPVEPDPPEVAPQPAPAPAPRVRVTFAGPPGADVYLDGVHLGETNVSYEVPIGDHRCGVGEGAPQAVADCVVASDTRLLVLPAIP